MIYHPLFRRHAGRMPGPARWYLAVMAILSLMLMAAHFTVQAHAQNVMRRAVYAWLHPMGGKASRVRYHLLRGALTINDLRIRRGPWSVRVPRISLHASTRAMLSKFPHFSRVHLDGMSLSLPRADLAQWLQGAHPNVMTAWLSVMDHAGALILANGRIRFTDEKGPWQVRDIAGRIAAGGYELNGDSGGGIIRLHGERNHDSFRGEADWKGMATARLIRILGLETKLQGKSSGALNWHTNGSRRRFMFDGNVRLMDQPNSGDIRLKGEMKEDHVRIQARCRGISLAGLGDVLPAVHGRTVQSGIWTGDVQLGRQNRHNPWGVRVSGEARGIRLGSADLPAWTIGSMTLDQAMGQWSVHHIHVKQMQIHDMNMALQPGTIQPPASPWQFQIARLTFENVRPSIVIRGGSSRFLLPPMGGGGHLKANGYMDLNATSSGDEAWRITGTGYVGKLFSLTINAEKVPVVRLRPLLPHLSLPGSSGDLQLSGNSQFRILLRAGNGKLRLQGQMTLTDVMVSQGGNTFLADAVHIGIQQAGMLKVQQLGSVRIEQWRYQAALHPIPRTVETDAAQEEEPQHEHEKPPWQVGEITASDGAISLGSEDAVWADHASFSLKKLRAGTWSPLVFHASVGGGKLRVRGRVDFFSADTRMNLNARLTGALPFFLNNWLVLSGSPRLIRGRLDGSFYIKPVRGTQAYRGELNLMLRHGQFESGAFPQDPMLPLTGFSMRSLLERLARRGLVKMDIPFRGDWQTQPFFIEQMGVAALKTIRQQASSTKGIPGDAPIPSKTVSYIRLKHGHSFSHNEHVRLWQVVKILRKKPGLMMELLPQLGDTPLDKGLISRVRHTQAMIEHYMYARGIAKRRIYPVWPVAVQRHGDITGIKITVRMP